MTVTFKEFWRSNYYNHPPLTDEVISVAEHKLGVKLPDEFIKLLKIQNGGYTHGFAFPMNQKTTWAEDHVPLKDLFGIVTDPSITTAQNILDTSYMTEEWGLPEKQVLLSGEGHWWITLDYRNGDIPIVAWIDVDCGENIIIANSFSQFVSGLVPISQYEED